MVFGLGRGWRLWGATAEKGCLAMDFDEITPAPAGFGPPPVDAVMPAPPRGRGRRFGRRARIAALVVVVAALVAGVAVWAPWTPNPPTAVHVTSPTAGTAVILWTASKGGASPSHYLVLRDGKQVGSVASGVTSYTDHGLVPGTTYHYTVIAAALVNSGPSARARVTTAAPSPVGLVASQVTHTSVALHWSPPPNAPAPDHYVIYNGTNIITTVPGATTAYTDKGETPGAQFEYDVVARWGSASSAPSGAASGQTLAAPLTESVPVHIDTTSIPPTATGVTVGYNWNEEWWAAPACSASSCDMTMQVTVDGGQFYKQFSVGLHPSDGSYLGSAKAQITSCGPNATQATDTVTLTLSPRRGSGRDGAWGSWTGTMEWIAPPMTTAGASCPAGTWTFALTSR